MKAPECMKGAKPSSTAPGAAICIPGGEAGEAPSHTVQGAHPVLAFPYGNGEDLSPPEVSVCLHANRAAQPVFSVSNLPAESTFLANI